MIASAHLAAGIVIGLASDHVARRTFTRVSTAFVAGALVHLLMDAVPHSDYDLFPMSTMWFVIAGEFLAVLEKLPDCLPGLREEAILNPEKVTISLSGLQSDIRFIRT